MEFYNGGKTSKMKTHWMLLTADRNIKGRGKGLFNLNRLH